jgi:hypothetical protein
MSLLGGGLQLVALILTALNILLAVLVVAAIALMFFLYVTKRQIVIIQGEPIFQQPVGESVQPYRIEISTKSC